MDLSRKEAANDAPSTTNWVAVLGTIGEKCQRQGFVTRHPQYATANGSEESATGHMSQENRALPRKEAE